MKTRIVFNNNVLDNAFKEEGYVVIDLMEANEAKIIYDKVVKFESGVNSNFYTSLWSKNLDYRNKVDQLINSEVYKRVNHLFNGYSPLFGDLLVKKPSMNIEFPIHQDWTFVDETIYDSLFIWCPLQDVHFLNGNLQVVPRSHHFLDKIRGANLTVSYEGIKPLIKKKYVKNVPLRAGQAIIFNQALLHSSPPNRSFKTRIALGLLLLPEEAGIFHYFYDNQSKKIFKLSVDREFFMKYSEKIDFKNNLDASSFILNFQKYNVQEIFISQEKLNFDLFKKRISEVQNGK